MTTELRLHGQLPAGIEYFATAAGCRSAHQHFYHMDGSALRFFSAGNELLLGPEGVRQTGNGGTFCEYMFGVEQPLSDLTKEGILNRLILLGAFYNSRGQLEIGDHCSSFLSYDELFIKGHAIDNYFFFVDGLPATGNREKQEALLRCLGKSLKRIAHINRRDDSHLAEQLLTLLPANCSVYLVRLSHINNRHYQQEFQSLYYRDRALSQAALNTLDQLAGQLQLAPYQQERIRIDVMYRHRDNYRIIDEYKKVLVDCYHQGEIDRLQHARLTRLRTLALRNEIPAVLLTALDEKLQTAISHIAREPEYTAITRDILQDLLQRRGITNRDMIQLLFAKQHARLNHDHGFEQLLLESGQIFDEQIRDGAPLSLLEDFSYIITFFDRYDSTSTNISRIAFMENFRPTLELIHSLLDSRGEFNKLVKGLFEKLFFDGLLNSRYLGRYGRRKLVTLRDGLESCAAGISSPDRLEAQLKLIESEEELYHEVLETAKKHIRNGYCRYGTPAERRELLDNLNNELLVRGRISHNLAPQLFQTVIHDIEKEALYVRQILPKIIADNDSDLRNDFLHNSGLDYFYIEELEREYYAVNNLDREHLQQLRAATL